MYLSKQINQKNNINIYIERLHENYSSFFVMNFFTKLQFASGYIYIYEKCLSAFD